MKEFKVEVVKDESGLVLGVRERMTIWKTTIIPNNKRKKIAFIDNDYRSVLTVKGMRADKWCYLDDLLALEQQLKEAEEVIGFYAEYRFRIDPETGNINNYYKDDYNYVRAVVAF